MKRTHQHPTVENPEQEVPNIVDKNDESKHGLVPVVSFDDVDSVITRESSEQKSAENNRTTIDVHGKGSLTVSLASNREDGDNCQSEKLHLTIENPTSMTISLTAVEGIRIKCDGDYEFKIRTQGQQNNTHSSGCILKQDECKNETEHLTFPKTHRRNDSGHLYFSGENQPINDILDAQEDIEEHHSVDENSDINEVHTCTHKLRTTRAFEDNAVIYKRNARTNWQTETDNVKHAGKEFKKPSKDCLRHTHKTRVTDDRVNLSTPIRNNFKTLLREIRLLSLCDHLYENYVIDMDTCEALSDATRNGRPALECARLLLFQLSKVPVKKKALMKSLVESDHDTIIPLLLAD